MNEKAIPLVASDWYLHLFVALEIFFGLTWRSWFKKCYFLSLSMNGALSACPPCKRERKNPNFTQIPLSRDVATGTRMPESRAKLKVK